MTLQVYSTQGHEEQHPAAAKLLCLRWHIDCRLPPRLVVVPVLLRATYYLFIYICVPKTSP